MQTLCSRKQGMAAYLVGYSKTSDDGKTGSAKSEVHLTSGCL